MTQPQQTDLTEVVGLLIQVYARQAAILKLIHQSGVDETKIEEQIRAAQQRIQQLPVVAEVARRRLPPPQSLANTSKGFRWNL